MIDPEGKYKVNVMDGTVAFIPGHMLIHWLELYPERVHSYEEVAS